MSASLSRGQLQQSAVRGALWTGLHTLVSMPLAFVVNILIARVLGVEGYGRLAYLTTVIAIATVIAEIGVTAALVQFGAKAHASGDSGLVKRYLSGAQGFRLLVVGPLVAVAVLILVEVEPWLLVVAVIFGVGAPALFGTAKDVLTIENRTDRSAQLSMFGNLVTQCAVVAALFALGTADAVWSSRVIASGLLGMLPLLFIARRYRSAVLRPGAPWRLPRRFWKFAIPTGLAGIVGALTSNRVEVVFLDWFSTPAAMGIFGLAFGLAGHVYAPAQALVGPLIPAVSGLSRVDAVAVRRAFLRTSRVASTVGGVMMAGMLVPLATLIPVLYGKEFASASDHVVLLGVASGVMLVGSPHQAFLMARLGGRRLLGISLAALGVNLALAFALIPVLGVWGATICCSAAMVLRMFLVSSGEGRALSIPAGELVHSLGGLLLGAGVGVLMWSGVRSLESAPVVEALVAGGVGAALHIGLSRVLRLGMTKGDAEAIVAGLPQRLRRVASMTLALTAHYR